ncbi:MAG: hypothetical protein ACR2MN_09760 [Acidimicrobiales bacterium]
MIRAVSPTSNQTRAARSVVVAVVTMVVVLAMTACGSSHDAKKSTPTTAAVTSVTSDRWKPPQVPGPASTAKFCALLVAQYDHIGTNTRAANLKVRQQIVADYVRFTPTVIDAAPPQIAPAATTYLQSVAKILGLLNSAGLDPAKTPRGSIGAILLDPQVAAASAQVLSFSEQYCHYDIAGNGAGVG